MSTSSKAGQAALPAVAGQQEQEAANGAHCAFAEGTGLYSSRAFTWTGEGRGTDT